ncbi:MAG TPA: tetratricopeptide repeat protein, partial [Candidatus Aminicenantes bacterium]|nr:tetratricopeptide repeat protein [Candidatus Aminicenantes bacterium]
DVLPTVLELLHLPPVAGVQGRSFAPQLTGGNAGDNDSAIHYFESLYGMEEMGFAPLSGLIRGSLKFISLPRPELYDLAADPGERDNLYLKRNVLAKKMARELDDHLAAVVKTGNAALRPQQTRQDQSRLRALGYLASANSRVPTGGGEDPKDGIATMNLLVNAREAIRAGKLEEAERQLTTLKARGIDRRLAQFHDTRYELALARKNPTITEAVLREAIARFPDEPRFLLILSAFYRDHGNERGTEETSLRLIERDPQAVEPHLLLGELYRRRKQTGPALAHFKRAWELRPDDPKLALALADMQISAGHPEQALPTLKSLLQTGRNPLKTEIRSQAAKLLTALGEPGMAEDLLQGLVHEQGDNPGHWTQLGLAQLDRGLADQALRSFQQALQLDPHQSLALSGLGTLHLTLFRQRKDRQSLSLAREYFGRAVATDPKLVTAMNGLGVVCLYQGEVPRAIEQFRAATRIDPAFTNAYFNLAIAQLSLGRRVVARQTLKTIQTRLQARLSADEKDQLAALLREAGI